jgi:hypothetical protein
LIRVSITHLGKVFWPKLGVGRLYQHGVPVFKPDGATLWRYLEIPEVFLRFDTRGRLDFVEDPACLAGNQNPFFEIGLNKPNTPD